MRKSSVISASSVLLETKEASFRRLKSQETEMSSQVNPLYICR